MCSETYVKRSYRWQEADFCCSYNVFFFLFVSISQLADFLWTKGISFNIVIVNVMIVFEILQGFNFPECKLLLFPFVIVFHGILLFYFF